MQDFVAKYQDKEASQQVIGHFGLGFYSSFMVAERVEIDTLSCRQDTEAVRWSCDGSINFSLAPSERKEHGTSIILHISDESSEMVQEATLQAFCRNTVRSSSIRYVWEANGQRSYTIVDEVAVAFG